MGFIHLIRFLYLSFVDNCMKFTYKKLIFLYILLVLAKILISYFIKAPSAFSDEYIFAKIARSFFYDGSFSVHGFLFNKYTPLYPMLLSVAYFFSNMEITYFVMKVINAFVSSLVVFPAYLIAKDFVSRNKAFLLALLVGFLPATFAYSSFVLTENLFFPLMLFSVYFIYKSFSSDKRRYPVLAGLFIGLSFLTRSVGVTLLAPVLVMFAYQVYRRKVEWKKFLLIGGISLLVVSPWLLRNVFAYGFSLSGLLGKGYALEVTKNKDVLFLFPFLVWTVLYSGFLILASGIVFSMNVFNKKSFGKMFVLFLVLFTMIAVTILTAANHNSVGDDYGWLMGRPLGRYIDSVAPLLLILGFLSYNLKNIKRSALFFFSLVLGISGLLALFVLLPINNMSLTFFGLISYFLNGFINPVYLFVIFFALLPFLVHYFFRNIKFSTVAYLVLAYFVLVNVLVFGINVYNSDLWYNNNEMQAGLFMNGFDKGVSSYVFDERDEGKILKSGSEGIYERSFDDSFSTVIGFWLNDEISVDSVENFGNYDFVVSKHNLDYEVVFERNDLYVYRVGS